MWYLLTTNHTNQHEQQLRYRIAVREVRGKNF